MCSAEGHCAFECPERADLKDKRSVNKRGFPLNLRNHQRSRRQRMTGSNSREERDGKDEESHETHMISSCSCNYDKDENDECVYC